MRIKTTGAILALILVVLSGAVSGQWIPAGADQISLEYQGSTLWSAVRDVAVSGNYAYATSIHGVMVFNIGNQFDPILVSKYRLQEATGIEVQGHYAYVLGFASVEILDISNPANLTLAGRYDNFLPNPTSLTVNGNYVYILTMGGQEFQIVDISNPASPKWVGWHRAGGHPSFAKIAGNTAFVGSSNGGCYVFDITNPAAPDSITCLQPSMPVNCIATSGNYAFISGGYYGLSNDGIYVYDFSVPTSPTLVTSLSLNGVTTIAVEGTRLYAAVGALFQIYDITNPASPSQIASPYFNRFGTHVMIPRGDIVVAVVDQFQSDGLAILEVLNPSVIFKTWDYHSGFINHVALNGNYAYVSCHDQGFEIVDISNPTDPKVLAPGNLNDAFESAVVGNYLYITGWNHSLTEPEFESLHIMDISNPLAPQQVYQFDSIWGATNFAVSGNYAYLGTEGESDLTLLNISDPNNVIYLGKLPLGAVSHFEVVGNTLYASVLEPSCACQSFKIYDCTNPVSPVLIGRYDEPTYNQARELLIRNNYAYLSTYNNGLEVMDISDPTHPTRVSYHKLLFRSTSLAATDHHVFIGEDCAGGAPIDLLDVADPGLPRDVGSYKIPGTLSDMAFSGGYAYVADGDGFTVLKVNTCCTGTTGNVDSDADNTVTISDLTALVDFLFAQQSSPLSCAEAADLDESGSVDIGDLTALVSYLFEMPTPRLSSCF